MAREGQRRGSSASGTRRLFFAFGTGIVGLLYLVLVFVPVVTGRVEFGPTGTNIETIEGAGFPDAACLSVENGNIVFAQAHAWLSGKGDRSRLFQLTAPVVSDRLLDAWNRSEAAGGLPDFSALRLVAVFKGDYVKEQWPEVLKRAEAEEALDVSPVKMSLVGDTVVAKGQLGLPTISYVGNNRLDWTKVRRLSHGDRRHGVGRLAMHLAIALALLAASFLTFRYHRRHPTKPAAPLLDLTPLADEILDI